MVRVVDKANAMLTLSRAL